MLSDDPAPRGDAHLRAHLEGFLATFDFARHRAHDPIAFVYRYPRAQDREIVVFFAALLAYGRVDLIRRALEDVVARIGPNPAEAAMADDLAAARRRFDGFVYRVTRGEDLARLWVGLGHLRRQRGSLLAAFMAGDPGGPDLRPALIHFQAAIRAVTAAEPDRQGFKHLLPNPAGPSPVKRLQLALRWLVRGPDGVDLGLWRLVGPERLTMPLDTHVHRIGRYLGLTTRDAADLRTATEITTALQRFDARDPLRFDFALAHLGISGACPSRRVADICATCPLEPVCRLDEQGRVGR